LSELDKIVTDFLSGDMQRLRDHRCPKCGGRLHFSVARRDGTVPDIPGRRYAAGISIYCVGACNYMLCHLDGFCPAWAESVSDWDAFSERLYAEDESWDDTEAGQDSTVGEAENGQ
jgi:hypothetical protein